MFYPPPILLDYLDIETLSFMVTVAFFLQTLVLLTFLALANEYRGINLAAWGNVAYGFGFSGMLFRNSIADAQLIVGAIAFQLTGALLLQAGLLRFTGIRFASQPRILFGILTFAAAAYTGLVAPNNNIRMAFFSFGLSILLGETGLALLRSAPSPFKIAVNLTGLIEVSRAVLPQMLERRSGHIINMSSVAGWVGLPMYSIYSATKFGVRGFTDALRREVSPLGIQVSGIYPGPATTEFFLHTGRSQAKHFLPSWVSMTSEYVASQVVKVAKHPRRRNILPGWSIPAIWLDENFPALADWLIHLAFTKRYRDEK